MSEWWMPAGFSLLKWTEIGAVIGGVLYVVLIARENRWGWPFGILGSALSIYLFLQARLYAESLLYLYYVAAGFYGWYLWSADRPETGAKIPIGTWPARRHVLVVAGGVALSLALAWVLQTYTNAQMPIIDAHTTVFSFIATFMAARKILSNWIYWIVIDAVSVWLYQSRGLFLYALLMTAYTLIAFWGYWQWRKHFKDQLT